MRSGWREAVSERFPSALLGEPMSRHTTFRIGGPADCYVEVRSEAELSDLALLSRREGFPLLILGWGSNLLVRDGGVRGAVARLRGDFESFEALEGSRVRAGAGLRVPALVLACAERGLAGAEPLVGVPGTVGGALVMNAGTREGEIGGLAAEVSVLEGEPPRALRLPASELEFRYRGSSLEGRVVLGCVLQLKAGGKADIMTRVQELQRRRLQTQPVHTYNVGSIFRNPPQGFVARMIEEAGLKGRSIGGARVSPLHANFIENFAGATAADVLELVELVRSRVRAAAGVELDLEMKVVGEP